jgi:hypothetical protein
VSCLKNRYPFFSGMCIQPSQSVYSAIWNGDGASLLGSRSFLVAIADRAQGKIRIDDFASTEGLSLAYLGALIMKTLDGRTWFSVNVSMAAKNRAILAGKKEPAYGLRDGLQAT